MFYRVTTHYRSRNRPRGRLIVNSFAEQGPEATAAGIERVLKHLKVERLEVQRIDREEFQAATLRAVMDEGSPAEVAARDRDDEAREEFGGRP